MLWKSESERYCSLLAGSTSSGRPHVISLAFKENNDNNSRYIITVTVYGIDE